MNLQLINPPSPWRTAKEQILYNRGVPTAELEHYTHLTDKDIHSYLLLGEDLLKRGAIILTNAIKNNKDTLVIVDCDADGYTSAALIINYLYSIFPQWVVSHIKWFLHSGKQHGLGDCLDEALKSEFVIIPDASSNDMNELHTLAENQVPVLILDHHLADIDPNTYTDAVIINNQLSDYPNKELSGVGVTWQFCRYMDSLLGINNADNFIDLVALGNSADMMSLLSLETRYLITKGFRKENIKNPFIEYMIDKNEFALNKDDYKPYAATQACSNMGAAFYITPFLNAITRSGTLTEKELIFKSMLEHYAYMRVPEIKYNKPTGRQEALVLKAVRVIGNVKNRQSKAEDAGLAMLEQMIQEQNMLQHGILLFTLEPDELEPEIRGLIANKFMAKYQRPCIIVSKGTHEYAGSMRGYTKNGLDDFKDLLEQCPGVNWVRGHSNAAGISLDPNKLTEFIEAADILMQNYADDPVYRVDYIFKSIIDYDVIFDIATMNDFWGQDVDRAYVALKFKVTPDNFTVLKSNTLQFTIGNIKLIKFGGTEEEIDTFSLLEGWIEIEAYCKCTLNSWMGRETAQLKMEAYEITNSCKYTF